MKPIEIKWEEEKEPDNTVVYNYVIGRTPIGIFLITWKGWKLSPSYDIEKAPFDLDFFQNGEYSLEDAKKSAQLRFNEVIELCMEKIGE